ncbi:uncharacterized protein BXZ73DRAFT_108228 [Epithele typhae]|uniref:uncharacterized protein n=1 Tax=Epithele typhae TaxID=378194 RepID=UPI002007E74C|nr:uncharacterized protein BXZ73DRAFT_108228 [Epithele typhae]KAH9911152.1 hypothetical protein BXZ73DRAFT_108228 [Epithele typhae]
MVRKRKSKSLGSISGVEGQSAPSKTGTGDKAWAPGPAQRGKRKKPSEPSKPHIPSEYNVAPIPPNFLDPDQVIYDERAVEEAFEDGVRRGEEVLRYAPRFFIPLSLDDLPTPTHNKAVKAQKEQEWDQRKPAAATPFTCIITDDSGKTILAYLGRRLITENPDISPKPISELYEGRTNKDLVTIRKQGELEVVSDGLSVDEQLEYLKGLQYLSGHIQPTPLKKTDLVNGLGQHISTTAGICRVILEGSDLCIERDLKTPKKQPSDAHERVEHMMQFYTLTARVAAIFAGLFKALFPEEYVKYKAAFDAGSWIPHDPGPWLGRVIVWKLQVQLHWDGGDGGPTLTCPMGYFNGGEMEFPDLNTILQ